MAAAIEAIRLEGGHMAYWSTSRYIFCLATKPRDKTVMISTGASCTRLLGHHVNVGLI